MRKEEYKRNSPSRFSYKSLPKHLRQLQFLNASRSCKYRERVLFTKSDREKELDDVKPQGEQCNRSTGACGLGRWFQLEQRNKVTSELQRQGFKVVAAQIPMTSLTDDVTALRRVLRSQVGPVVLAGHSYGGAVITAAAAGDPKVKALV